MFKLAELSLILFCLYQALRKLTHRSIWNENAY